MDTAEALVPSEMDERGMDPPVVPGKWPRLQFSCKCNGMRSIFAPPMMHLTTEHSLGFWCARIGQRYFNLLHERLGHLGIERGYFTLALIVENEGRISQQQLADALHMDKVAMARCIDHLCERGYVRRAACPNDGRKHHLEVLPKALPAAAEIKKAYAALNRTALKEVPASARASLFSQLRAILDDLHAQPLGRSKKRPS
jgi:DNA-binding MarR family transcriptional regulator